MPSGLRRSVAALGFCLLMAGAWPAAQIPAMPSARMSSSGSAMLSSSVFAEFHFKPGAADLIQLDALVLFRGRPGWYTQAAPSSPAGSGASSSSGGNIWSSSSHLGGIQLTVRAEFDKSLLFVQGRGVDLRDGNVVLVDQIDDPAGPIILDTLRIDAQVPFVSGGDALLPIINAAPDVKTFLRCGVPPPRPTAGLTLLCGKVTP